MLVTYAMVYNIWSRNGLPAKGKLCLKGRLNWLKGLFFRRGNHSRWTSDVILRPFGWVWLRPRVWSGACQPLGVGDEGAWRCRSPCRHRRGAVRQPLGVSCWRQGTHFSLSQACSGMGGRLTWRARVVDVSLRKELWNPAESQGEDGVLWGTATPPSPCPCFSEKTARISTVFCHLRFLRCSRGADWLC